MHVLFNLNGRISRADFWLKGRFPLIALNIFGIQYIFGGVRYIFSAGIPYNWEVTVFLYFIMLIFPTVAIYSKRLHDRDKSAWYILVALIPVVGPIGLFIETGFLKGTVGDNRFGADPLKTT
jgi:uncharacterized membrane protein YhaH (DUF805 family)